MEKQGLFISLLFSALCASSVPIYAQSLTQASQNVQTTDTVFQFGGTYSDTMQLAKQVPQGRVVNISLQQNQKAMEDKPSNVEFTIYNNGVIENLPKSNTVIVRDLFTQQAKQQALLDSMATHLLPDGTLLLYLSNYKHGPIGYSLKDTWVSLQEDIISSPNYILYSPEQYTKMLEKNGLKVQKIETVKDARTFSNISDFKRWLHEDWSYAQGINSENKALFLKVFADNYLEETKQSSLGPIVWEETVLAIQAKKPE